MLRQHAQAAIKAHNFVADTTARVEAALENVLTQCYTKLLVQ